MPNLQHQLLSTTNTGKLVYQLGTDSTGVNHYRHHTNDSFTTLTLQTNRTERPNFTNGSKPITTDLRHLSLTANNITAKLTNQFIQTGLRTFDWQQLFTWLWWWLPLTLWKRQSPLPTTVLLRTTLTWTIKPHYYMLPPGSNHLLYIYLHGTFTVCLR